MRFLKKYFKPVNLSVASVVLVVASFASYVAGLLRDLILSYYFGADGLIDAYYTAFLVPDLIFNITIVGILSGVFIPVFRAKNLVDEEASKKLAGAFIVSSQILVAVLSVIAFFSMPIIVSSFFGNADVATQGEIIKMSRLLLLSPFVFALSNTLGSILMSFKYYLSYSLSPALYNFGIIGGILMWHDTFGVYSAVYGVIIGLFLHLGVRFFDLINLRFKMPISWKAFKMPELWEIYKLSIPKSLGLMFNQLAVWVYNIIGYSLVAGSITMYNYARNIQSFAVSLFGIAIATAVFPYLVDTLKKEDRNGLRDKVEQSFLQIVFYTVPAAFGMGVLSQEVIQLLFGRGNFSEVAVLGTAGILFYFAFSIPFESLIHLLSRVFYVFKNTWTPVLLNLVFLGVNIFTAFKFAHYFGPSVFAISFSAGVAIQFLFLLILLQKYVKFQFKNMIYESSKILLSAGLMAGGVFGTKKIIGSGNLQVLILIGVGVILYLLIARFLGLWEHSGINRFKKKL